MLRTARAFRTILAALSVAVLLAAGPGTRHVAAEDQIVVNYAAVPLVRGDMGLLSVGGLVFRGALTLTSADRRFGGFSALHVSANGEALLAVSDHGDWLAARLHYDHRLWLAALTEGRMGRLLALDGKALSEAARERDAESMTVRRDASTVITFERHHRIWSYPASEQPFAKPPRAFVPPPDLGQAPSNEGLEAFAELDDGRFLAISEGLFDAPDRLVGWLGDGTLWQRLYFAVHGSYRPTDAKALPNGDVLVLERKFHMIGGFGARLRRIPKAEIAPGATLRGEALAELEAPMMVDNFEGLAVRRGERETLVYLISDDNFLSVQSTILMLFAIPD
ncbi:MAG: esterase-like activity of phytase family protein [Alphaproteobacteria bacterium]